jgi:enoyl-CoA hydratase
MAWENIQLKISEQVATLTIDRPKALNALDPLTFKELEEALLQIQNNALIRVLVITGGGDKAFVAGSDIKNLASLDVIGATQESQNGMRIFDLIATMPKPVIAAVNGFALGGGCELAMACDIRIASDKAKFGQPEVKLGVTPGYAGTQRLPRIVGKGMAYKLLFTGDMINAEEALRIGLVQEVYPAEELMVKVMELAQKIAQLAPLALAAIKHCVNNGLEVSFRDGCTIEAEQFGLLFDTKDLKEGMNAFIEKRSAHFSGE